MVYSQPRDGPAGEESLRGCEKLHVCDVFTLQGLERGKLGIIEVGDDRGETSWG